MFTEVTGASRLSNGEVSIQDGCIYLDNSNTKQYSGLTLNKTVTLKSSETIRVHIASGDTYTDSSYKPRVVICDAKPTGINTETGNPSGTNIIASKTLKTSGSSVANQHISEQTVEIPVGSADGSRYIAALISGGTYVSANLKIAEISIWLTYLRYIEPHQFGEVERERLTAVAGAEIDLAVLAVILVLENFHRLSKRDRMPSPPH